MDNKYNPPMQWHSGEYASIAVSQPHVTLLDHFAGQAMQGLCSSFTDPTIIAQRAYGIAKEMLKARQESLKEDEVNND